MMTIREYKKAESLEEAWQLNQKKPNRVLGGMIWLKMENINVGTAIDLSGLGLDTIEETDEGFSIGAMVTLRQLELHPGLAAYTDGAVRESVRHIVGVQLRNVATVGGSIYARFGFSDVLTCMMALDSYVELHHGGVIPMAEFAARPVSRDDRDVLVRIIIRKDGRKAAYTTQRNSQTDFPLIACCVSRLGDHWYVAVGARPGKAKVTQVTDDGNESLADLAREAADAFNYGSNNRGSGEYRHQLARVYVRRLMERLTGRSVSKA